MRKNLSKPVLLYDGDCRFCRLWIDYWKTLTEEKIDYEPYQEVVDQFSQVSEEDCRTAVQLLTIDGQVFSAAEAVFRTLAEAGRPRGLWCYEHLPGFARISERLYQFIAHQRGLFYKMTVLFSGEKITTHKINKLVFFMLIVIMMMVYLLYRLF